MSQTTVLSIHKRRLIHNLFLACVNGAFVYLLVQGGALDKLLASFASVHALASLVAGFFFTSLVTTGPAIILLGKLSASGPWYETVLFGAIGATMVDLLLFRFVRDVIAEDLTYVFSFKKHKRLYQIFHTRFVRHLWPLIGGLIIASPLPDEFGITLLGISKLSWAVFLPVSLFFNMLGISMIVLATHVIK